MKAVIRDEREMKDSGIEWIGKIPKAWGLRKAKYVADFNPKVTIKFDENLPIGYVPMDAVKLGYMEPLEHDYNSLSTGLTQFQEDDIIMAKVTPCFENGEIAIAKNLAQGVGFGSSELFVYRTTEINQKYFFYYLQQLGFVDKATSTMTGTGGLKRISSYFANNAEVTLPSTEEQRAIANYLDDRCSKIDTIIAEAKASIEEYNELKQAVIYEAVTKGLDKNVEMKDSGVEWIGVIPYDWHLEKINHVGVTSSGATPARHKEDEYFSNANISWIKTLDLNDGHVKYSSEKITLEALNSSSCSLMPVGTVCVAMYGGAGTIGKSGILDFECATNQAICSIVCNDKKQVGRYLQYQLQAMRSYWMKYAVGTRKDPNISQQTVAQMKVLVPPISIQISIADYLDDKIMDLESLISEKQSLIEDLEAYKKSLIYEVVTGKRKVVA